jgi:glycosyltransferase involved in cell wall biosynthesis
MRDGIVAGAALSAAACGFAEPLPRLLVLSDVNVERTGGGALAMYRLLADYPKDRLCVVSYPTANWPGPIERLEGVDYRTLAYRIPRVIFNRFNPFWPVVMAKYITLRTGEALAHARQFRPDTVLTVAHHFLWFVADRVARRLDVPLHLILHDDWPHLQSLAPRPWVRPAVVRACEAIARPVLRRAAQRYAVSPNMAERYEQDYGVRCRILYPCRGEDSAEPAVRVRPAPDAQLVVAYAGMIHQCWTVEALRSLAGVLERINGRLDVYAPYAEETFARWGLVSPNIRRVGFLPSARAMAEHVAASAHALFLPASFAAQERRNVATLFPSKLADYTAIGLPLVVWGPSYSSASRWAAENSDACVLVTDSDPAALLDPLTHLFGDPEHARRLAAGAIEAGMRDFDPGSVRARFLGALVGGSNGD